MLSLIDLNDFVLTIILEKLLLDDIVNLYYVCRKFRTIIERHALFKRSLDLLLVGHRNKEAIAYQRTLKELSYIKRLTLYQNWTHGRYEETILFHHRSFNPSHLHLEKENLYMTNGGQLRIHKRLQTQDIIERKPHKSFGKTQDMYIRLFTKKCDEIFIGRENGHVNVIPSDIDSIDQIDLNAHRDRIEFVDFDKNVYVTTTFNEIGFWRKEYELGIPSLEKISIHQNGFKCLRLSPNGDQLALGKYSERQRNALRLMDVETQTETILNSNTYSIYDILWRDQNTILTGNYDTTFRLFDCRTNCDQCTWTDPYDLAVYCLQYDGNYAVLCGMKYHSRVNLYDLRIPNRYIQLYFPTMKHRYAYGYSPAYSVVNDQSQLFIATDHNLRVLNFDADWAESKDYTDIFLHESIVYV